MFATPVLETEATRKGLKLVVSIGDPSPLGRHWRHSHDKMDQAFPLHFCILQVIKNWTVGMPGNKASGNDRAFISRCYGVLFYRSQKYCLRMCSRAFQLLIQFLQVWIGERWNVGEVGREGV